MSEKTTKPTEPAQESENKGFVPPKPPVKPQPNQPQPSPKPPEPNPSKPSESGKT